MLQSILEGCVSLELLRVVEALVATPLCALLVAGPGDVLLLGTFSSRALFGADPVSVCQ